MRKYWERCNQNERPSSVVPAKGVVPCNLFIPTGGSPDVSYMLYVPGASRDSIMFSCRSPDENGRMAEGKLKVVTHAMQTVDVTSTGDDVTAPHSAKHTENRTKKSSLPSIEGGAGNVDGDPRVPLATVAAPISKIFIVELPILHRNTMIIVVSGLGGSRVLVSCSQSNIERSGDDIADALDSNLDDVSFVDATDQLQLVSTEETLCCGLLQKRQKRFIAAQIVPTEVRLVQIWDDADTPASVRGSVLLSCTLNTIGSAALIPSQDDILVTFPQTQSLQCLRVEVTSEASTSTITGAAEQARSITKDEEQEEGKSTLAFRLRDCPHLNLDAEISCIAVSPHVSDKGAIVIVGDSAGRVTVFAVSPRQIDETAPPRDCDDRTYGHGQSLVQLFVVSIADALLNNLSRDAQRLRDNMPESLVIVATSAQASSIYVHAGLRGGGFLTLFISDLLTSPRSSFLSFKQLGKRPVTLTSAWSSHLFIVGDNTWVAALEHDDALDSGGKTVLPVSLVDADRVDDGSSSMSVGALHFPYIAVAEAGKVRIRKLCGERRTVRELDMPGSPHISMTHGFNNLGSISSGGNSDSSGSSKSGSSDGSVRKTSISTTVVVACAYGLVDSLCVVHVPSGCGPLSMSFQFPLDVGERAVVLTAWSLDVPNSTLSPRSEGGGASTSSLPPSGQKKATNGSRNPLKFVVAGTSVQGTQTTASTRSSGKLRLLRVKQGKLVLTSVVSFPSSVSAVVPIAGEYKTSSGRLSARSFIAVASGMKIVVLTLERDMGLVRVAGVEARGSVMSLSSDGYFLAAADRKDGTILYKLYTERRKQSDSEVACVCQYTWFEEVAAEGRWRRVESRRWFIVEGRQGTPKSSSGSSQSVGSRTRRVFCLEFLHVRSVDNEEPGQRAAHH